MAEKSRAQALLLSGASAINDCVGRLDIHSGSQAPAVPVKHPRLRISLVKPEGVADLYRHTAKTAAASAILTSQPHIPERSSSNDRCRIIFVLIGPCQNSWSRERDSWKHGASRI
jgi:hypothetical protein